MLASYVFMLVFHFLCSFGVRLASPCYDLWYDLSFTFGATLLSLDECFWILETVALYTLKSVKKKNNVRMYALPVKHNINYYVVYLLHSHATNKHFVATRLQV